MAEVVVSGYYGFGNTGDEAILGGIIRSWRALDPDAHFTVVSGNQAATRRIHGVSAVGRPDIRGIWRALGRADVIVLGGGSLLQDVTSRRTIPYYSGISILALLQRRPVAWYAQGIGPIRSLDLQYLVRWVGNRVNCICVRDEESGRTLKQLGITRPPVVVTADAALAIGPGDSERGRALLRTHGVPDGMPLIGVSLRPWPSMPTFEQVMAQELDTLAREMGAGIVFIPMQMPHDQAAAEGVRRHLQAPSWSLGGDMDYQQTLGVMAAMQLAVGLRYHALVFAAMSGVPLVGLSYDPKNDSFLRLLGLRSAGSPDRLEAGDVVEAARGVLTDPAATRAGLLARTAELAVLSAENARLALGLVKGRRQ